MLLIHERIARAGGGQSWEEFAEHNPDLLVWKGGILGRYYKPASLDSDLARQTFLFPDVPRWTSETDELGECCLVCLESAS